ncbi:F0F1 ATP synthase subunit B [Altererythrobacter sp. B11]|uniref:F0F1 ATP synthase subunit B family protein n=1 Tax=Altererythrobacter sp. B11 TaxID=2060312 RepID=UPI000DC70892|nr:hypothetical protein [Altererythrobacter sp. B11]BBC72414.1 F0F1 ATP synthase subunit B [Altererythrobacter sp. B11]
MAEHPPEVFTTSDPELPTEMTGHDAGHTEHAEPIALGLTPGGWVGLAMLVFLGILIWKGVLKTIGGGLDTKIAAIREQLEEAKTLRREAEALRAEYAAKIANAEKDAAAMLDHAKSEAEQIVAKAQEDAEAVVTRRKKMAEDKIAAAERGAVEELRARAATAATQAARGLIAGKHDAAADTRLVNETISAL